MTAARIRNRDGSVAFDCTGCGAQVAMPVDDGFDFPVCAECRWFGERPWLGAEVRARAGITATRGKQAMAHPPRAQRRGSGAPTLLVRAIACLYWLGTGTPCLVLRALALAATAALLILGGRP